MRAWSIVTLGFAALVGSVSEAPAQPAACPQGQTIVCAEKFGERQSYWNVCAAERDGAFVLFQGECPPRHSSGV